MSLANKKSDTICPEISPEEYLKGELESEVKHEYRDGHVYAMAGASKKHNQISRNILYALENNLRQKKSTCETFSSDMKVKLSNKANSFFYPDVMVTCEDDNENEYYQNYPVIIIEVLSKSTRKNDSSSKMLNYFNCPTLDEYVLVEQDFCQVQVFRRKHNWQSKHYFPGDEITFESINVTLTVEDIYYQVGNEDMLQHLQEVQEAKETKERQGNELN